MKKTKKKKKKQKQKQKQKKKKKKQKQKQKEKEKKQKQKQKKKKEKEREREKEREKEKKKLWREQNLWTLLQPNPIRSGRRSKPHSCNFLWNMIEESLYYIIYIFSINKMK